MTVITVPCILSTVPVGVFLRESLPGGFLG